MTETVTRESWIKTRWRPAMGWSYFSIVLFDFIFAPIFWSLLQAYSNPEIAIVPWVPLTLQGGGLYHLAMGGVLGITAWSRGQEKIKGSA